MSLLHFRERRRLTLLAAGALLGAEREQALAHAAVCAACAAELREIQVLLAELQDDPVHGAEMPVSPRAATARVLERLDGDVGARARRAGLRWALGPLVAGAASVLMLALLGRSGPTPLPATTAVQVSADALQRLERTVAREQAVRYLNEAQDVLVTVAAAPRACRRVGKRVDVGEEARRSRELLVQRALLVDAGAGAVASAAPVLRDVEEMLHEVALLEPCARASDLEAIHREIGRRNLLMKIDLMTRELQG